ncbi:MAG: penicillin acylase family protein [Limnobacter sp.]|nr:penicillin acylase family protein [Limnobacter sp.]
MFQTPEPLQGATSRSVVRLVGRILTRLFNRLGWLSVRYPSLTLQDRLAEFKAISLPLEPSTTLRFNSHFVPYIQAQTDVQAAIALGAITEFQRGPQLQFFKRLAQGRLSEMGGRQFVDMDHLLRLLNFGHAAEEIWKLMPQESKGWVEGFVQGLNAVQSQRRRAVDERLMAIKPEPYTPQDILLFGRLAGADVNWPIYFSLIEHHLHGDWLAWWDTLKRVGAGVANSFEDSAAAPSPSAAQSVSALLNSISRSGSNSFALSGLRTQSGAPLLANDPHLGQHLPNVWMMVGIQSPSYRCVGLMFPGVPVLGLGRNPDLAWGGTNLRSASSDVVQLDAGALCTEQTTQIKVRWGWARQRKLSWSAHGPVLTDCSALGKMVAPNRLALRWAGHWPTDEISCFLKAMRSQTVQQLHEAMAGVGVTPLNVLGVDSQGNIGHVLAATLPQRVDFPEHHWVLGEEAAHQIWGSKVCASDLPRIINPPEGYLVSANNRPSQAARVGFLFSGDDRILRARQLLSARERFSAQQLQQAQLDTTSPLAQALAHGLAGLCSQYAQTLPQHTFCQSLKIWDGSYSADNHAALQFECVLTELVRKLAQHKGYPGIPALMEQWAYLTGSFLDELMQVHSELLRLWIPQSIDHADHNAQRWQMWGNLHKVRLRHVLGYSRVLGKLFSSRSFPAAGSRETLMKNAHNLIRGFDETSYGSQSRHLSDMSDLDSNFFVLLGGQDGWVGSQLMQDQIPLWRSRQSIQMPLRSETIDKLFPH